MPFDASVQVNRKGDVVAQSATSYNPAEIAYFKALVASAFLLPLCTTELCFVDCANHVGTEKGLFHLFKRRL